MVKHKVIDWIKENKLYNNSIFLAKINNNILDAVAECNILNDTFILYNIFSFNRNLLRIYYDFIKHFDYIKKLYIINEIGNRSEKLLKRWNFSIVNELEGWRIWLKML